ncbi:MAG: beta-ketoacyl synthase N-terminal-like domain-containing protein [Planctomycetota bacterium]
MSNPKIVITGYGVISAYGSGCDLFLSGINAGKSLHQELTLFEIREGYEFAAEIHELNYQDYIFSTQPYVDRTTAAALIASREALESAGLTPRLEDNSAFRTGIAYASCWGAVESMEKFSAPVNSGKPKSAQGLVFVHSFINSAASVIAMEYNLQGFSTVSTGRDDCARHAMESAVSAISSGKADVMLVGAAETISELNLNHLINKGYFTEDDMQSGTHFPGEGAAFLVLEKEEHAEARGCETSAIVEGIQKNGTSEDNSVMQQRMSLHGDCFSVNPFLSVIAAVNKDFAGSVPLDDAGNCMVIDKKS